MIFYYSATGNSLYVARMIDDQMISIPQAIKNNQFDFEDETIGIISPIYAGKLPQTVCRFIEKMKIKTNYFYMLLTYGNEDSVAGIWSEKFCQEHGIHVDFIQTIKMVDNYLPVFDMDEQKNIDKNIPQQIELAKDNIEKRVHFIPQPTKKGREAFERVSKRFEEHPELNNGESIVMTDRCVGCGICQQVCPIGNIELANKKAKRIHKTCDFCLACVHNCPLKAIDVKNEKNPDARYRHPQISLKDIVKANNQLNKGETR